MGGNSLYPIGVIRDKPYTRYFDYWNSISKINIPKPLYITPNERNI
jgi:hypothetical protein